MKNPSSATLNMAQQQQMTTDLFWHKKVNSELHISINGKKSIIQKQETSQKAETV